MKRLTTLLLALIPLAPAQQPPGENALAQNVLLDRLYAYAAQYRATLPSFECDESILSWHTHPNGKSGKTVRIQGTIREIRKTPPDPYDPFTEQHQFKKANGKSVRGELEPPYFIEGGFANLIGFHYREQEACFKYRMTPLPDGTVQLEIDRKDKLPDTGCKGIYAGTHYAVIADAEGHILHSERTIPPDTAWRFDEAYFAAIDYAPQRLGDQTFWLPTKFSSHNDVDTGTMDASYSNCHRYTGNMKVLSDLTEVKPDTKP
jgi:hypothetical protein